MSRVIKINRPRALFRDFSLGQLAATVVAAVIVSVIAAAVSVWVAQAQTETRLSAVEKTQEKLVTREVFDERWKTVDRIWENLEKLRDRLFPDLKERDGK
ncbi:MAG TPA: hypothetical protein VN256_08180 [Pyrinomonadaceae bacterium]|nr:hypothetical protein [Pyrinomonadaceae bacterium]